MHPYVPSFRKRSCVFPVVNKGVDLQVAVALMIGGYSVQTVGSVLQAVESVFQTVESVLEIAESVVQMSNQLLTG